MKIEISIVVPIYNSAEFLRQCLDSLKNQTMKELEFILVNDGSTDDSLKIMSDYKKEDARFHVIDKNNTGYGDSLNKAIEIAKGKYIGIVEPDDFCDKKMFEKLYSLAVSEDADIARGSYYEYSEKEQMKHVFRMRIGAKTVLEPVSDYEVFFEVPAIWSAIYKKDLLTSNEIKFLPTGGAAYQDTGFNFKTLASAKIVVYTNEPFYYYRVDNPNSSVKDLKKSMAVVKEFESIEKFIKKLPNYDSLIKYCQVAKFGAYHWNIGHLDKEARKKFVKVMRSDFEKARKEGYLEKNLFPKKYWWSLQLLLNSSPSLYLGAFMARKHLK